jgi:cytochrome P450 family 110
MKLPDGPKSPYLYEVLRFMADPPRYLEKCAQRYGDVFLIPGGGMSKGMAFVGDPKAVEEIFALDPALFDSSQGNDALRPLVGENSLILLNGDEHRRQRSMMLGPLQGSRIRAFDGLICDVALEVAAGWKVDSPFQIRDSMQQVTLRVILRAVFGIAQGSRYDRLSVLVASMMECLNSPLTATALFLKSLQWDLGGWSPWGRLMKLQRQVDELLFDEIRERRDDGQTGRGDILALLMSARDEHGRAMTDQELRDQLITMLIGGHETTATALSWAFCWIHELPQVRADLLKELDEAGRELRPAEVVKLPYLNAVCQESLRLYPVALASFGRMLRVPLQIGDYEFAAGMVVTPCVYLVHHRPELYPDSKRFRPERFLERSFSLFEFLPFGGGSRRCIGASLAVLEMQLVLATILSRYELALVGKGPVRPQRRGIGIEPATTLKIVLKKKRTIAAAGMLSLEE